MVGLTESAAPSAKAMPGGYGHKTPMAKGPLRRKAKQYNNDPANAADRMAKASIFFFVTATLSRTMRAWPLILSIYFSLCGLYFTGPCAPSAF